MRRKGREERLGKVFLVRDPAVLLKYFRWHGGRTNGASQTGLGIRNSTVPEN